MKGDIKDFCDKRFHEILNTPGPMNAVAQGATGAFKEVINFIDSQQPPKSFEKALLAFKKEQFELYEHGKGFDWDDIVYTIEETAKHFYNLKNENIQTKRTN